MKKPSGLYITNQNHRWLQEVIEVYSSFFDLKVLVNPMLHNNETFGSLLRSVNQLCATFDYIFIHYEFAWEGIGKISKMLTHPNKVILFYDDVTYHNLNCQFINHSHHCRVFTSSPLSKIMYQVKGFRADYLPIFGSRKNYYNSLSYRPIDIFFSGSNFRDREVFVKELKKLTPYNVNVELGGGMSFADYLSKLRSSKIVVNLSKGFGKDSLTFLFKERVLEAGFSGAYCITERTPELSLLFSNNIVREFSTADEMKTTVEALLNSPDQLVDATQKFTSECELYRPEDVLKKLVVA